MGEGKRGGPLAGGREIFSWCMYDFANSSFTTLIVTLAYSVYFREVVVSQGSRGDLLWGRAVSLSMLIVALAAPVLGAMADRSGSKKKYLMVLAGICILCTAMLSSVKQGQVVRGMILFVIANVGFAGGNVFYNAFLPEIADRRRIGRISGWGWALGYAGGLACLALVYPLLRGGLVAENLPRFRFSFAVVAAFFLVFSLPAFLFLRGRLSPGAGAGRGTARSALTKGYRSLRETLGRVRQYRDLVRYLAAFFLYNDGIHTVTAFSSIYAVVSLGFTMGEVTGLFIIAQLTAFLGAITFGPLMDRIGGTRTIRITLVVWCLVVAGAFLAETKGQFAAVVLVAGFGMGSNQAASRGLMGLFIPPGKNAEFFGFFALCGKFSAILGPYLFGWISATTGDQRLAILSLLGFFLAGLVLLAFVNEKRGIREAGKDLAGSGSAASGLAERGGFEPPVGV